MNGSPDPLSTIAATLGPQTVVGALLLFCRIGACLMLAPGLSTPQAPTQARLFIALAVTLALAPVLIDRTADTASDQPAAMLRAIAIELAVGGLIGLLGRLFFLALETMAVGAASMLGFANPFGMEIEPDAALPPLATAISLSALALLFAANLHYEILRGLVGSYDVIPVGAAFDARMALRQIADVLAESFRVALRVSSPFVIYALIVNLAISIINRMTPQIAIFYVATPFVAAGGLLLLYFVASPMLDGFIVSFGAWLVSE